jgi:hypothetical protein
LPGMLIVVTVETQQFPIAAIGGIIVVIVVTMMDRKLIQIGAGECPPAATTYPGIEFQGPFTVALFTHFPLATCPRYHLVEAVIIDGFLVHGYSGNWFNPALVLYPVIPAHAGIQTLLNQINVMYYKIYTQST